MQSAVRHIMEIIPQTQQIHAKVFISFSMFTDAPQKEKTRHRL